MLPRIVLIEQRYLLTSNAHASARFGENSRKRQFRHIVAKLNNAQALLQRFKQMMPHIPTKSGLMLGLGETDEEVIEVMKRMREHDIDMLTLGQYLQPSRSHLPVQRFVHPDTFAWFAEEGYKMGFKNVASGPLVRSSYHADEQAKLVKAELMSS